MNSYEFHPMNDPRLPFIFHTTTHKSNYFNADATNWHENIELLFFRQGEGLVRLNDRQTTVAAGDIVAVNPNTLHNISSGTEGLVYNCLIVDRVFCTANCFDTNMISFKEHIRDKEIFALGEDIAEEFARSDSDAFAIQAIRAKVLLLMSMLCRRYSTDSKLGQSDTRILSCIKQAIGFIHSESNREISLDELADFVCLSKYYFAREFHTVTGYTFTAYLNFIRCKRAKQLLLETQKSVGEISAECGFSDQSYFTKVFKKYYGESPTEIRSKNIQTHI